MTKEKIVKEGSRAESLADLMRRLGYSYTNAGSNTYKKFRRVLGKRMLNNIVKGKNKLINL